MITQWPVKKVAIQERKIYGQHGRFKNKILVIKYKLTECSMFKTKKIPVLYFLKTISFL